jgi:dihydroorotate dehydrogenase (NAD+) catalytic subunit
MAQEISEFRSVSRGKLIASVFGRTPEEFALVADRLMEARPDMIEANVSCPNVRSEFGEPFGANVEATVEITRLLKRVCIGVPLSIKLTVNCPSIARMALAVEEAGADCVTAINTAGPGMLIDINTRRPILSNKTGGVSGPAMFPIALRAVYQIRAVSKIPIIATGGVRTAEDALQLFMAGATAIGVGTAVYSDGIEVFQKINQGLEQWMSHGGIADLDEIRGVAHV